MTERKRAKKHRRTKMYRKAYNILKNNVPRELQFPFTPMTVAMAPRMIGIGRMLSNMKRPPLPPQKTVKATSTAAL